MLLFAMSSNVGIIEKPIVCKSNVIDHLMVLVSTNIG